MPSDDGAAQFDAPVFADRVVASGPVRVDGEGPVVYWCTSARRSTHSVGLQYAAEHARSCGTGLVVLEALRIAYPYASPRFHQFIVEGMRDQRAAFNASRALYYPYVEPKPDAGKGLLAALSVDAPLVVADHFPMPFLRRMVEAASRHVDSPVHIVDGNGLMPLAATDSPFTTAVSFRRFLQKHLPERLLSLPAPQPLPKNLATASLPSKVEKKWPASHEMLDDPTAVIRLPLPNDTPAAPLEGGPRAGAAALEAFVESLPRYLERSHPDAQAASGLSPYLHFGHVGAQQAAAAVLESEQWSPDRIADSARGQRQGWWGVSEAAEAWLDQLVTWRELGYVEMHHRPEATRFESLPEWAKATLDVHRGDSRDVWTDDALAEAQTDDPVWNAAQRELLRDGTLQNHLRMLWGKRILAHSATPEEALKRMYHYNNGYALDGRDPNSVSGIMWCLGRYDRGWPEREVFGKVRCMTSQSTGRKLRMERYLERYG